MKSRRNNTIVRRVSGRLFIILFLALASIGLVPAAETPARPDPWLDCWVSQKGTTKIEVRPAAEGLYEVVIVWVSEDADSRVKESLGKILASGFLWDSAAGEFKGGTLTELRGSECRMVPVKNDTLELIVKKGFLTRTIPWTRSGEAS